MRHPGHFTLQWHLTQACDLHCRHCYDRAPRPVLSLAQCDQVLAELLRFTGRHRMQPTVTLTGGNPLYHPHFLDLYRMIDHAGVPIAILGNPAPRETLAAIAALRRPRYYQLSLEGLPEHNDLIRGPGHFARVLATLDDLQALGIPAHVMLTATRDNLDQILPLAQVLRGRADRFTFNRLAPLGEGADLATVEPTAFRAFLEPYHAASHDEPMLRCKDNLFNRLRHEQGLVPRGGCTGHGCGAAFDFVALLPDGEVHACRKFPSPLGNLLTEGLEELWRGAIARRYRAGAPSCRGCSVRDRCGGCPAVHGRSGLTALDRHDPCCPGPVA